MSREGFAGLCLQLAGRFSAAWGEWVGDSRLAASGRRHQAVGRAQQAGAMAREHAARELREFQHHNRNWYF